MKTLTVFTPAYNRAHLLPRLYESLKNQTSKDFLWLIIDDGSRDNTKEVVQSFREENCVEIQYIFQYNQGMHGAHNTAYKSINTELNTCIDSDDFMPDNAVELIVEKWNSVIEKQKYAGIIGLDAYLDSGKIVGGNLPLEPKSYNQYYDHGVTGDKKLVYRTEVINSTLEYPIFEGEKYVGLAYKYMLIDLPLIPINDVLVIVDYQETGSSNNMWRQYYNNPKGFAFLRVEQMKISKSNKRIVMDAVHYVSSSLLAKNKKFMAQSPRKLLTILAIPAGVALCAYTLYKNRKTSSSKEL